MLNITLSENNKIIDLKSYTPAQMREITKKEVEIRESDAENALLESRLHVLGLVYPELKDDLENWPMSAISELYTLTVRYSVGGKDAVKNSLTSGNGTQAEA